MSQFIVNPEKRDPSNIRNKAELGISKVDNLSASELINLTSSIAKNIVKEREENGEFKNIKDYARHHHERYDGKGYPSGLVGDDIPLCAQVAAIADVYDALTTPRVYKPAFSHEKTVRMIISGECGAFSEKIKHCFRLVSDQFEEKARQYRDGEINLEEFGFTPEIEENSDIPDYLDNYRYNRLIKESGDIVLEIDYSTKKHI